MIIKILLSIIIYFALVILICIFFKGATYLGNRFDEEQLVTRYLKRDNK